MIARFVILSFFALVVNAAGSVNRPINRNTRVQSYEQQALQDVSNGSKQFAGNFLQQVFKTNPGKNLVSSPFSISLVLAMLYHGAGGNTQEQLRSVLHLPRNELVSRIGHQAIIDRFNNSNEVTLNIASKIFANREIEIKQVYRNITSENFRSEIQQVNFANGAEAAGIINRWVESQTNHKVKKIFNSNDVSAATDLVLSSTLYFRGIWKESFSDTYNASFHVDARTEKTVQMMELISQSMKCYDLPDLEAQFVELPYTNEDFSMVIILPNAAEGLSALVEKLANVKIETIRLRGLNVRQSANVRLPKFKIESSFLLDEPLKQMGLADMFSGNANFSNIANRNMKVGKVIQKAVIEVNEHGTEAAAASAGSVEFRSYPDYSILADHPFLYIVQSRGITLFAGAVYDPSQGSSGQVELQAPAINPIISQEKERRRQGPRLYEGEEGLQATEINSTVDPEMERRKRGPKLYKGQPVFT